MCEAKSNPSTYCKKCEGYRLKMEACSEHGQKEKAKKPESAEREMYMSVEDCCVDLRPEKAASYAFPESFTDSLRPHMRPRSLSQ